MGRNRILCTIENEATTILLQYRDEKSIYLHAQIRCPGGGYDGIAVSVTPDMLADLRDAIQDVLDVMGVEE